MSQESKRGRAKFHRKMKYVAGFVSLFALIAAALRLPQLFFGVQDSLLYGKINLGKQEQFDILKLEAGYESSLFRRMANFSEGIAEGRQYYIGEQDKDMSDLTADLMQGVNSVLSSDMMMEVCSQVVDFSVQEFNDNSYLRSWKQYVIYSDDYAQGVNYCLWCFTFERYYGHQLTLLIDAQDYTVYALRLSGEDMSLRRVEKNWNNFENFYYTTIDSIYWILFGIYYDIFDYKVFDSYGRQLDEAWKWYDDSAQGTIRLMDSAGNEVEVMLSGSMLYKADGERWYERDGTEESVQYCYRLPFQGNTLSLVFECVSREPYTDSGELLDLTIGIAEIYGMIPEFQNAES